MVGVAAQEAVAEVAVWVPIQVPRARRLGNWALRAIGQAAARRYRILRKISSLPQFLRCNLYKS